MTSTSVLYYNQVSTCKICNFTIEAFNWSGYKVCRQNKCSRYAIKYIGKPLSYEEVVSFYSEEFTLTYLSKEDKTYFHPMYNKNETYNYIVDDFYSKEVLFSIPQKQLFNPEVVLMFQNHQMLL